MDDLVYIGRVPIESLFDSATHVTDHDLQQQHQEEEEEMEKGEPDDDKKNKNNNTITSVSLNSAEEWGNDWGNDWDEGNNGIDVDDYVEAETASSLEALCCTANSSSLTDCIFSVSASQRTLVMANKKNYSVIVQPEGTANDSGVWTQGARGSGCDADECITSLCCLTLAPPPPSSSSVNISNTMIEVVVVGYSSGVVRFFDINANLLLRQLLNRAPVTRLHLRSNGMHHAWSNRSHVEDLSILFMHTVITIDGFSLYQCLRACRNQRYRRLAGEEVGTMPMLAYKKWLLRPQDRVCDVISLGACTPSAYDYLVAGDSEIDATTGASRSVTAAYIVAGSGPMLAYYATTEGDRPFFSAAAIASNVVNKVASSVFSIAKSWWGSSGSDDADVNDSSSEKDEVAHIKRPIPIPQKIHLRDSRRTILSISVSPIGDLVVTTDSFGRIMILDVESMIVVRMWKGYRDAQCAWLESTGEVDGIVRTATFLVIFAPRRGLVEIWQLRHGGRVAAFVVGTDSTLLGNGQGLLGASGRDGNIATSRMWKQCLILKRDGQIVSLTAPFHWASRGARGQHVFSRLTDVCSAACVTSPKLSGDKSLEEAESLCTDEVAESSVTKILTLIEQSWTEKLRALNVIISCDAFNYKYLLKTVDFLLLDDYKLGVSENVTDYEANKYSVADDFLATAARETIETIRRLLLTYHDLLTLVPLSNGNGGGENHNPCPSESPGCGIDPGLLVLLEEGESVRFETAFGDMMTTDTIIRQDLEPIFMPAAAYIRCFKLSGGDSKIQIIDGESTSDIVSSCATFIFQTLSDVCSMGQLFQALIPLSLKDRCRLLASWAFSQPLEVLLLPQCTENLDAIIGIIATESVKSDDEVQNELVEWTAILASLCAETTHVQHALLVALISRRHHRKLHECSGVWGMLVLRLADACILTRWISVPWPRLKSTSILSVSVATLCWMWTPGVQLVAAGLLARHSSEEYNGALKAVDSLARVGIDDSSSQDYMDDGNSKDSDGYIDDMTLIESMRPFFSMVCPIAAANRLRALCTWIVGPRVDGTVNVKDHDISYALTSGHPFEMCDRRWLRWLAAINDTALRGRLCFYYWHNLLAPYFLSLLGLIQKNKKYPKERLIRKSVDLSDMGARELIYACEVVLDLLVIDVGAYKATIFTSSEITGAPSENFEEFFSSSDPVLIWPAENIVSTLDLPTSLSCGDNNIVSELANALGTSKRFEDIDVNVISQLALATRIASDIFRVGLRSLPTPILALFPAAVANGVLSRHMDLRILPPGQGSCALSLEATRARESFVVCVCNNLHASAFSNVGDVADRALIAANTEILALSQALNVDPDVGRRQRVYRLFVVGRDQLAEDTLRDTVNRDSVASAALGASLLLVIGRRLQLIVARSSSNIPSGSAAAAKEMEIISRISPDVYQWSSNIKEDLSGVVYCTVRATLALAIIALALLESGGEETKRDHEMALRVVKTLRTLKE